ncbi:hypothetical protein BN6_13115 [Saccharothrix espanaensis DSM 44229]|uniref:Uncharacterized protein n=1 Tax=Saccharothrix espanaensis (strain ATCC 51144 / DSM 44229 / JCM 9112 / NBRC 15066 / NRRL 15764) TaxID=1179773 RepID=K0JT02_SACES|nr:hypothetical protein BN6_13115 [Saccharothrix espanaensis DSM 44229]
MTGRRRDGRRSRFFTERIFGPDRRAILAADLSTVGDREARERDAERDRLRRVVADLARRQNSIIRQAQDGDPDDPFTRVLRGTYNDLEAERHAALSAVAALDATDDAALARTRRTWHCWTCSRTSPETCPTHRNRCCVCFRGNQPHRPDHRRRRPRDHQRPATRRHRARDHQHGGKDQHHGRRTTRNAWSRCERRSCGCCTCPRQDSNLRPRIRISEPAGSMSLQLGLCRGVASHRCLVSCKPWQRSCGLRRAGWLQVWLYVS